MDRKNKEGQGEEGEMFSNQGGGTEETAEGDSVAAAVERRRIMRSSPILSSHPIRHLSSPLPSPSPPHSSPKHLPSPALERPNLNTYGELRIK